MANTNTKKVILDIKLSYKQLIDGALQIQKELKNVENEQKKLNKDYENGKVTLEKYNSGMIAINAETKRLKDAYRDVTKEIDANLKKEEAQKGSLKQMRQELKLLIKAYDELSQTDREAIGGVGEEKLVEIRRLQEELRNAEEASGRFQRSVGSYEDAIRRALDGTIPMKSAMRELKNEIQTLEFQYRNYGSQVQEQEQLLNDLALTVGKDNDEYRQQEAELQRLNEEYAKTGQSLEQMKTAAGQMDDAIRDTNQSIKNFGADNANLKAATQGAELLLNGYTALKAGMTALGIESEELYNVFSKIQILQQGLNAVNKIANMLEKQSVFSQQAKVLWTTLTTKSIATLTAAKKKDAVASTQAAAADTALAAGETAATAAAGGLTVALKAVGTTIKSIPVIGWILAAVAALGTLTALLYKHIKAERDENEQLKERRRLEAEINELDKQALQNISQQVVKMQTNVRYMKELKEGTKEWDDMVVQVANDLGVDVDWLKKNKDKVDELVKAWINLQTAMALGEAAAKAYADTQVKIATAEADIYRIMRTTDPKKRTEELKSQLGMTEKVAQAISKAFNKFGGNSKQYKDAVKVYTDGLKDHADNIQHVMDKAFNSQVKAQENFSKVAGDGISKAGDTSRKEISKTADKISSKTKELSEELEDLMVEGMADGLEKQIAEVQKASDRYVEKMKEAREQDKENAEYYDKIILEKERQTMEKIKKLRSEGYKNIISSVDRLTESYNKMWESYSPNSFYNFVKDVEVITKDVHAQVLEANSIINKLERQIAEYKNTKKTQAGIEDTANEQIKKLNDKIEANNSIEIPVKPEIKIDNKAIANIKKKLAEFLENVEPGNTKQSIEYHLNIDKWVNRLKKEVPKELNLSDFLETQISSTADYLEEWEGKTAGRIAKTITNMFKKAVELSNKGYDEALKKYNEGQEEKKRIDEENAEAERQITEETEKATQAKKEEAEADDKLRDAEDQLNKLREKYRSGFEEDMLSTRKVNKAVMDYAKTMRQVLLEQAKLGNISVIPDNFSAYIDYQTDMLEEELAKSYSRLEKFSARFDLNNLNPEDDKAFTEELQKYKDLENQLAVYKEAKKNVYNDQFAVKSKLSFFDNKELLENEQNIARVKSQIDVMNKARAMGKEIIENDVDGINTLEAKNKELYDLRLGYLIQINNARTEADKKEAEDNLAKADKEIEANNKRIKEHKKTLALIGYTTDEEMKHTIDGLQNQLDAFADNTFKIMASTAASVLQSINTVVNSLTDLFNEIGEDQAEMQNFLEGIAYVQIGVNMATGIAEAITAGAGEPFPYNLAAIATGIAAVVAGITSAFQTYKKYHKDVTSPSFATGGLIGMRYARTKQEGVADNVPINASVGEYIIKADKVRKYGVEFFDKINYGTNGRPSRRGPNFADGGVVDITTVTKAVNSEQSYDMLREALMDMPNPIVSVREVTNVQRRVEAKERISKR